MSKNSDQASRRINFGFAVGNGKIGQWDFVDLGLVHIRKFFIFSWQSSRRNKWRYSCRSDLIEHWKCREGVLAYSSKTIFNNAAFFWSFLVGAIHISWDMAIDCCTYVQPCQEPYSVSNIGTFTNFLGGKLCCYPLQRWQCSSQQVRSIFYSGSLL